MQLLQTSGESSAFLSEETLIELLSQVKPAIIAASHRFRLESDDLYQQVAVIIIESAHRVASMAEPRVYCLGIIRRVVAQLATRSRSVEASMSLDEPLSDDSTTMLSDLIADPSLQPDDRSSVDALIEIVHQALHRLPLDEQEVLIEKYQLASAKPRKNKFHSATPAVRSKATTQQAAYRHLRRDVKLAIAFKKQHA